MEVIDNIQAWQVETGDLIQFEVYEDEDSFVELLRVIEYWSTDEGDMRIRGYSEILGEEITHEVDRYLDLEVMGA